MIPEVIVRDLASRIGAVSATELTNWQAVSGGSINQAWQFRYRSHGFFVKFNHAARYPGMFEAEADGLKRLQSAGIRVPEVIAFGSSGAFTWLLQRLIVSGRRAVDFEEHFGRLLASLHRHNADGFGHVPDNWIGSLPQRNANCDRWTDFFREQRIDPLLREAISLKLLPPDAAQYAERLFSNLENLFPSEPPALLHGDLWSGNRMTGEDGLPVWIDPAVYYGFREMDLAMTRLFGGFDRRWEDAYREIYPLTPGFEERVELCNLYPLLVHVVLFGGGYADDFLRCLRYYSGVK